MILDKNALLQRMKADVGNRLVIDPFFGSGAGINDLPASIDFHLGNRFLYPKQKRVNRNQRDTDLRADFRSMYVENGNSLLLHPGQYILGITLEWFKIPHDLMGTIVGRSAWGRRGLVVSIATAIHPGGSGNITLGKRGSNQLLSAL